MRRRPFCGIDHGGDGKSFLDRAQHRIAAIQYRLVLGDIGVIAVDIELDFLPLGFEGRGIEVRADRAGFGIGASLVGWPPM